MRCPLAIAAIFMFAVALSGCVDPYATAPDTEHTEFNFAAQAEAVRQGQSEQIRLDYTPVHDSDLERLDGLQNHLRRINLSRSDISDQGLQSIASMPKLIQLRLASDEITDAGLESLSQLKELRHLHLIGMPITDAGLDHLHPLKSLESLYLDGTKATDEGLGRLIEALPGVHLHFDGGHHPVDPHNGDHKH